MLFTLGFLALVSFIVIAAVEGDKWGLASLVLLVAAGVSAFFGNFNVFLFTWAHPATSAFWAGVYLLIGSVWSVFKWYFFVLARRDKYDHIRSLFLGSLGFKNSDPIPDDEKDNFRKYLNVAYHWEDGRPLHERPKAKDNKSRITTWMAFWPWSMVWTIISDPFKRLCKWMFTQLHELYEKISSHVYRGVDKDLEDTLVSKSYTEGLLDGGEIKSKAKHFEA